jgi:hypothetical protein
MKKTFLTMLLLLLSLVAEAQEKQFLIDYSYVMLIKGKEEPVEYKQFTRVFFNHNDMSSKIRMYYNDSVFDFVLVGKVTKDQTVKGEKYSGMLMIDGEDRSVYVQLFEEDNTLRLIFKDITLEFY